jgi:deoxyribodipyrimidine photolyase-related protein
LELYDKNEDKLGKNPRIGMMYNVWRKMKPEAQTALQADYYLKTLMNYKLVESY